MAFTGSEQLLSELIYAELAKNIPADSDARVYQNLKNTADGLARAIVTWILQAGQNAIQVTIPPGTPVAGAGPSGPITAQTVAPTQSVSSTVL